MSRIDDVGAKVGNAKKDLARARLGLAAYDAMTPAERAELVTKDRVWPQPDWSALIADGMPRDVAAFAKAIRDACGARPFIQRGSNLATASRDYVDVMSRVAVACEGSRTLADIAGIYATVSAHTKAAALERGDPDPKASAFAMLVSINKGRSSPVAIDISLKRAAQKLMHSSFPEKSPPWLRDVTVIQQIGGLVAVRGGRVVARGFADRETLEAYLEQQHAADAAKAPARSTERAVPERPHLDKLERIGPVQRDAVVTADSFAEEFGFRAVEWGNYLPQSERQEVLNQAWDAFADLADLLHLPRRAMSLGGTLAAAFGARGGGKAAAHYESGRRVFNMTRLRGAGSLCHEWGHALDHYVGTLGHDNPLEGRLPRYATGNDVHRRHRDAALPLLPPTAAAAVQRLAVALREIPLTRDEAMTRAERVARIAETRMQRVETERAEAEAAPTVRGAAARIRAAREAVFEAAAALDVANGRLAGLRSGGPVTETKESSFIAEAHRISKSGYWSEPTEMFARAFECAVFDGLAASGRVSEYLVHGVEEDRYAGPDFAGNPYPTGDERVALADMISTLVDEVAPLLERVPETRLAMAG